MVLTRINQCRATRVAGPDNHTGFPQDVII
jgi:hypothetical protein